MNDRKSDDTTRPIPNKHTNDEVVRKDESYPRPGKPLYQTPTEPWPQKPPKK